MIALLLVFATLVQADVPCYQLRTPLADFAKQSAEILRAVEKKYPAASAGSAPESEFLRFIAVRDYRKVPAGRSGSQAYGKETYDSWRAADRMLNLIPKGDLKLSPELFALVTQVSAGEPYRELAGVTGAKLAKPLARELAAVHQHVGFASNPLWLPLNDHDFAGVQRAADTGVKFRQAPWPLSHTDSHRGVLFYARRGEVDTSLKDLCAWYEREKDHRDPVSLAAGFQRRYVAIHPFPDGNGRTSRLLMDRILAEHGLPPPVLKDMDSDLYSSEDEWIAQVRDGIEREKKLRKAEQAQPGQNVFFREFPQG